MTNGAVITKIRSLLRAFFVSNENSLKHKSMRAAFWSMAGKMGGNVLRLGGSLILTRLLFPEAFGLMATATVALVMLQLFTDAGVHVSIIRSPHGDSPEYLNTAWTFAILRGFAIAALVLALAWPMTLFYGEPKLMNILFILAAVPLMMGFENPALALLVKRFRVERQVSFELGSQALGLVATAVLAMMFKSVYALAFGNIVGSVIRLVLAYRMLKYRPRLQWDKEAGRDLLRFGSAIMLNTMITWVAMKADLLLVGWFLGMDAAGFYNLGERFGIMIPSLCTAIFARAYMPAISAVQDDLVHIFRIYRRTVALVLTVALPVCIILCLFAPTLIELLYDPRYTPAAEAVRWLNLGSCVRIIGLAAGTTFVAMNRVKFETIAMAVGAMGIMVFIPFGARFDLRTYEPTVLGVAVAVAVATALIPLVESVFLIFKLRFPVRIVIRPWCQALGCIGLVIGIYFLLAPVLERPAGIANLPFLCIMSFVAVVVSVLIYIMIEGRSPFRVNQPEDRENLQ